MPHSELGAPGLRTLTRDRGTSKGVYTFGLLRMNACVFAWILQFLQWLSWQAAGVAWLYMADSTMQHTAGIRHAFLSTAYLLRVPARVSAKNSVSSQNPMHCFQVRSSEASWRAHARTESYLRASKLSPKGALGSQAEPKRRPESSK